MAKLSRHADTVIINANIYQKKGMDSIAVTDGMISFVGNYDEVKGKITQTTKVIDIDGRAILPGFIDLNNHVFEEAYAVEGSCPLPSTDDYSELAGVLEKCAAAIPESTWVIGFSRLLPRMNKPSFMPKQWLDKFIPERPVVLIDLSSDMVWVNSRALETAQLNRYSINPPGGRIIKTADKASLTGVLLGSAGEKVISRARAAHPDLCHINYPNVVHGLKNVTRNGITTLGDARSYWHRGWNRVWETILANGDLSARVTVRPWLYPHLSMKEQLDYFSGIARQDLTSRLIINQVKVNLDGSYTAGTARLSEPYLSPTLVSETNGVFYISPSELTAWLERLDKIGFGVNINATGDEAVKASLNAIQDVRLQDIDQVFSIHSQGVISREDVPRFASLNVSADFQIGNITDSTVLSERSRKNRTLEDTLMPALSVAGANVTLSSGWATSQFSPLKGIAKSLSMGSQGFSDIQMAIAAYTINPARALGLEGITGSIDVGKSADFVILDQDITELKPEQIPQVNVSLTMLEGEIVYQSESDKRGA
ncbi:amidohydrolase [Photobacterium sp. J15]|uniref:amidohydrolase n=1 Tax=Photobacterium sp. J15 TaxID=265901 RepID=UPI0018DE5706|nr:amidohydrolase family protein [Photobacterium sp. J15]